MASYDSVLEGHAWEIVVTNRGKGAAIVPTEAKYSEDRMIK